MLRSDSFINQTWPVSYSSRRQTFDITAPCLCHQWVRSLFNRERRRRSLKYQFKGRTAFGNRIPLLSKLSARDYKLLPELPAISCRLPSEVPATGYDLCPGNDGLAESLTHLHKPFHPEVVGSPPAHRARSSGR